MSLLSTLDAPEDQGLGATQMHDAAIDAGLVARPERIITVDEFNAAYREQLEKQVERMKEDRTVDELEELEEEGEDDEDIIRQLREKRIAEMKAYRQQKTQSQEVRGGHTNLTWQADNSYGSKKSATMSTSHILVLAFPLFPRSAP